jgi:hypothetical protein
VGSGTVSAAPKTGCPAADSAWQLYTVEDAAARIWPALFDQSPWTDVVDFGDAAVRPQDRNGDGNVCMKITWGEDLNPNSHWYLLGLEVVGGPAEAFVWRDNNVAASDL